MFVNFFALSALKHKEMRFITSIILIGQFTQAYFISWFYDVVSVIIEYVNILGVKKDSAFYRIIKWTLNKVAKAVALNCIY